MAGGTNRPPSDPGRRPLLDWERCLATQLGAELRRFRIEAGLSQASLAARAGVAERSLRRIEHGQRRTRRSTLDRLAQGMAQELAVKDHPEVVLARLLAAAGPTLAPESIYGDRVNARRRARRARASRRFVTQHITKYDELLDGVLETHWHSRRIARYRTRDRVYQVLRDQTGRRVHLPRRSLSAQLTVRPRHVRGVNASQLAPASTAAERTSPSYRPRAA
jgi:transcriptional regulator with XRE-family HTH domain